MTHTTQRAWVYSQLKKGKRLTALSAMDGCGSMRLAAIIHDLRGMGHSIITETKTANGKRFAEYRMPKGTK